MSKLSAKQVEHAKPGKHGDGNGLTLIVKASGRRSWAARYIDVDGKRRDKGLGAWPAVSLAEARKLNATLQADGAPEPEPTPEPTALTLAEASAEYCAKLSGTQWQSNPEQNAAVWHSRFRRFAGPILDKPVTDITPVDVHDVIAPLMAEHSETARILRGDIRRTIGSVMFRYGMTANPAGEALDHAFVTGKRQVQHRRALHHSEVAEALDIVDSSDRFDAVRLCLRFAVLTATRSREAREAQWHEIDFDAAVWTVPAERMKSSSTPHRVPLSSQALAVLAEARKLDNGTGLVFPSPYRGSRPVSAESLRTALSANAIDAVPHGFRTSFRGWALEQPGFSFIAVEMCLAHAVGNQVAQAYIRDADLLEERRPIMSAWADYITSAS